MGEVSLDVFELEKIVKNYTTYFIVFDIVFFLMLFLCVILLIRFLKSKKRLRDSDEYIRYVIQGQEEERARIARELHDTVAQNLRYTKSLCAEEKSIQNLAKISDILEKSLAEIRAMSYNLSPPDITKKDFLLCIQNLCEEFVEFSKLTIRLSIIEKTDASFLTKEEILNLYRIIQEALTNIVKHAKAEEAVLLIRNQNGEEEKGLYIFISDDGTGFDVEKIDSRKHYGIEGMKKRASLIGATLAVNSITEEGTQIFIFKRKL
ncbi:MAG: sensor histidine kinase [Treponema sp.]|nr:sensor histidine kinase [Treponema sp.]